MFRSNYPFEDLFGFARPQYQRPRHPFTTISSRFCRCGDPSCPNNVQQRQVTRRVPFDESDEDNEFPEQLMASSEGRTIPVRHRHEEEPTHRHPNLQKATLAQKQKHSQKQRRQRQQQQQQQQPPKQQYRQQQQRTSEPSKQSNEDVRQTHAPQLQQPPLYQQHEQQRHQHHKHKKPAPQQTPTKVPIIFAREPQTQLPAAVTKTVKGVSATKDQPQKARQRARVKAAVRIQRWFRRILKERPVKQQDEAARKIQAFMKKAVAKKRARQFCTALQSLHAVERSIGDIETTYMDRFCGRARSHSKDMLAFQEALDKVIISLDCIDIHGNAKLRTERKRIIKVAQAALQHAEHLQHSAIKIQRWWRKILRAQRESTKPAAALVLTRAMKALMAKRRVQGVVETVKQLRGLQAQMDALQAKFLRQLSHLEQQANEARSSAESNTCNALADRLCDRAEAIRQALTMPTSSNSATSSTTAVKTDSPEDEESTFMDTSSEDEHDAE